MPGPLRRTAAPRRWALPLLLAVWAAGCTTSAHLDDALFARLSVDRRLVLFDAENDAAAATDAEQDMREAQIALRAARRMAAEHVARAANCARPAHEGAGEPQRCARQRSTWAARVTYLDASVAYLRRRRVAQTTVMAAAQARLELAKARLALRYRLVPPQHLQLPGFVAQATRATQSSARALAALAPQKASVAQARDRWLAQRNLLVAQDIEEISMVGAEEASACARW